MNALSLTDFVKTWSKPPTHGEATSATTMIHIPDSCHSLQGLLKSIAHLATFNRSSAILLLLRYQQGGTEVWKHRRFREWKNKMEFCQTRHCFCRYGVEHARQPVHFKYNVLSLNTAICSQLCTTSSGCFLADVATGSTGSNNVYLRQFLKALHQGVGSGLSASPNAFGDEGSAVHTPVRLNDPQEAQCEPDYECLRDAGHGSDTPRAVSESSGCSHAEAGSAPLASKCFPTEARERQKTKEKRAKELGKKLQVKKKFKHVEDHYDDCGEDISSLHMELDTYVLSDHVWHMYANDTDSSELSDSDAEPEELIDYMPSFMLWGSDSAYFGMPATCLPCLRHIRSDVFPFVSRQGL